jgi:hypothetical protein
MCSLRATSSILGIPPRRLLFTAIRSTLSAERWNQLGEVQPERVVAERARRFAQKRHHHVVRHPIVAVGDRRGVEPDGIDERPRIRPQDPDPGENLARQPTRDRGAAHGSPPLSRLAPGGHRGA